MAIVVSIGDLRRTKPVAKRIGRAEKYLEKPFYEAELHRADMSRVRHPGQSNESVVDLLYVCAVLYIGISAYWFVKYVL